MPREYVPSNGQHKRGPKPGTKYKKKSPLPPQVCECDRPFRMGGDECTKCGKRLPDYEA